MDGTYVTQPTDRPDGWMELRGHGGLPTTYRHGILCPLRRRPPRFGGNICGNNNSVRVLLLPVSPHAVGSPAVIVVMLNSTGYCMCQTERMAICSREHTMCFMGLPGGGEGRAAEVAETIIPLLDRLQGH